MSLEKSVKDRVSKDVRATIATMVTELRARTFAAATVLGKISDAEPVTEGERQAFSRAIKRLMEAGDELMNLESRLRV